MNEYDDFRDIDKILARAGVATRSAEDEYFDSLDEADTQSPIVFPVVETFTRTIHYHYKHATVTKVERVITSARRNVEVHIYTGGKTK